MLNFCFLKDKRIIKEYNIYNDLEHDKNSTTENFSVIRKEDIREVTRKLKYYNLDEVISVGYSKNMKEEKVQMENINILAIGDIVGENAIEYIEKYLRDIKKKYNIDFVIANGENACKARGITKELFYRIINSGVDVITMGNHTYSNRDIYNINDKRLIVPINYNEKDIQKGYGIFECKGIKILVANVLGKKLGGNLNGFKVISNVLNDIDENIKVRVIDFHSEYCNEKRAMAHMLKNKVSVIYGTHTHVQTSDEKILYSKLGYITDIGMTGPIDSSIGYDLDFEVKRFLEEIEEDSILSNDNHCMLNGVVCTIDTKTGNTIKIKRIKLKDINN